MALLPFFDKINHLEAGVDEAGRGCLCGDVFAAAVILPTNFECSLLNDSKKLTDKQRRLLRPIIQQNAISWAIGRASASEIDDINILNASILSMHRALEKLTQVPDMIIIDGNRFKPFGNIKYKTIIKGDSKYLSIAAASVLAKTYRDDYMIQMDILYPNYGFSVHKGYPTKSHREAIALHGACDIHRKSFRLLK